MMPGADEGTMRVTLEIQRFFTFNTHSEMVKSYFNTLSFYLPASFDGIR